MNTLIIEDEKPAARRMIAMLSEADSSINILATKDSIENAVEWLKHHPKPDLIFMDIHLADGSSFEIFKKINVESPIIFVTAYDEYAIDAFKVNSVDYLLKPLKKIDLEMALQKLKNLQHNFSILPIESMLHNNEKKYKDRFVVRLGNKIISLNVNEIAYFFSKDKLSFIADKQGKSFPIDMSLDKIENLLNPTDFFRVNRQIITHAQSIKEIHTSAKSRIILDLVPSSQIESVVSSERSALFKKWLKKEL
jgi:two-component system, LytTR family, response regulator LytT